MINADALAEVLRQLAFIAAVIGGFTFAYFGVLLSITPERKVADWAAGVAMASAVSLITSTLLATTSTVVVIMRQATSFARLPRLVEALSIPAGFTFFGGLFLLFVSLGLCGFIRSRWLGITSSVLAGVGILVLISLFIFTIQ